MTVHVVIRMGVGDCTGGNRVGGDASRQGKKKPLGGIVADSAQGPE
jgi:hypothetical protein